MSGTTQPTPDQASASTSAQAQGPNALAAEPKAAAAASIRDDNSDNEQDSEDDAEDDANDANAAADASTANGQNAKQRKKKKSKAAAKLRKKLGFGDGSSSNQASSSDAAGTSDGKLLASGSSQGGKISDDVVSQVQKAVAAEHGQSAANAVTKANLAKVMAMMNMEKEAMLKSQEGKQKVAKQITDHKFWRTQPVMRPNDSLVLNQKNEGSIEPSVPPSQVRQEPYPLPSDFEWITVDVDNPQELKEVYDLLSANYVEDDDATLRFNYSPEFLHWVLKHPGYNKNWHIGVRVKSTRKLVAFISGIPHELRVRSKHYQSTEINFLCVHKKLRSKRLAPVLIKEVTRQCHLTGVFHAIYTVGQVLPTPVSCARYYHRTINAKKLVEVGFSAVPHNMSLEAHCRRYDLPSHTNLPGLREMETKDVPQVGKLLRRYMKRFDMAPRFSDHEVQHILLSGRGEDGKDGEGSSSTSASKNASQGEKKRKGQVTWTYVVEDPKTGKITDMFSFYSLPSSILDNDKHDQLNAAYLFYYATDVVFDSKATEEGSQSADQPTPPERVSSSSSVSERASALSSGKAPFECNTLTNLTSSELRDESDVAPWSSESATTKSKLKERLNMLIQNLLIIASTANFDVVNCLTVMDNPLFLAQQKFGAGDGFLRFYLFNWRTQPVCGGMGSRPGENELDPVHAYVKGLVKEGDKAQNKEHVQEWVNLARQNPADVGSGNGVVMV